MKKIVLLFICLLCVIYAQAQEKIYKNNEVDVVAEPYEGITTFYQTVAKKINVVNTDKADFNVFFVVEADGSLSNFNVEGVSFGQAENVITILKEMPKWTAAVYKSEKVRSQIVLPIKVKNNRNKN